MTAKNQSDLQALYKQNPQAANNFLRKRLAATGLFEEIFIANAIPLTRGGVTRIPLTNTGLLTGLKLIVEVIYTVATAAPTASPKSIQNYITNVAVKDFSNTARINAPLTLIVNQQGYRDKQLAVSHIPQTNGISGTFSENYGKQLSILDNGLSITNVPNVQTSVAAGQVATGYFTIPVCRDAVNGDYTGILNMQSTQGQAYLELTSLADGNFAVSGADTSVFNALNGGTVTVTSATVTVVQQFILPQPDKQINGQLPLPPLDLAMVFELSGQYINSGFSANQETRIPLPNSRNISAVYYDWYNNTVLGGAGNNADINQHRVIINGTTPIITRSAYTQYMQQRNDATFDLSMGSYVMDFVGVSESGKMPVSTDVYGNVQIGVTPNSVASPFLNYMVESTYMQGQPLGPIVGG